MAEGVNSVLDWFLRFVFSFRHSARFCIDYEGNTKRNTSYKRVSFSLIPPLI